MEKRLVLLPCRNRPTYKSLVDICSVLPINYTFGGCIRVIKDHKKSAGAKFSASVNGVLYPVYTCTFNPERNRFRSHASVYTTPTNPDQRFDPD